MANTVKYYAQKGYVGIVFSYSDLHFNANSDVGDLLKDCHDVMKYIATNFSFVDNENILLMGDSAGGHLALCLALRIHDDEEPALKLNKIVAYSPITDCVMNRWSYCADNAMKYSPIHNVKRIDAYSFVSIEDSRLFTEKMKTAGKNVSMIELPGAKHAFILIKYVIGVI